MFGKKSPTLRENHPHHVINFLAGYIKTGNAQNHLTNYSDVKMIG